MAGMTVVSSQKLKGLIQQHFPKVDVNKPIPTKDVELMRSVIYAKLSGSNSIWRR